MKMRSRSTLIALAILSIGVLAVTLAVRGSDPTMVSEQQVVILDPTQILLVRTPGGMLEVATLKRVEEFAWKTTYTCPVIDCERLLGATVTRLRVPVVYTYRIPLAATWELKPDREGLLLTVPTPVPISPPAIDTSKIEIETNGSWSSPQKNLNVLSTLRQLTPELERRATKAPYLLAQEPSARITIEEFAKQWMIEQGKAPPVRIRVRFESAESTKQSD